MRLLQFRRGYCDYTSQGLCEIECVMDVDNKIEKFRYLIDLSICGDPTASIVKIGKSKKRATEYSLNKENA